MGFVQQDTIIYEPEVLSSLMHEGPSTQREAAQATPLPESAFIQDNALTQMPIQPSTATKDGNVLRRRQVLAAAKLKAAAARRDIADQAKFDAAMAKLAEEEEKRAEAAEQKKAQALARKLAEEEKKNAEREAKLRAAEDKKLALAEKKKKAQEEKLALADQKKLAQEARKREAEQAKQALAEKKRLAMEARKKETEEAKRKEEEDARSRIIHKEEEQRQKAWEEHLKEKRTVAEEANIAQAAQFRHEQDQSLAGITTSKQNKRKKTQHISRNPYKLPRKNIYV